MNDTRPDAVAAAARALIRDVPDFPQRGILFKDITPLLADRELFRRVTEALGTPFAGAGITHVVGVESRGFIVGAPVAQHLGAGFIPVRKPGKLPAATIRREYALEYGTDAVEMHADALGRGSRVLLVDDVLATGGTAAATGGLIEESGATLVACSFLIELAGLDGRRRLQGRDVRALISY